MVEIRMNLWKSPPSTHPAIFLSLGRESGSGLTLPHLWACYRIVLLQRHFHACRHFPQTGNRLVLGYVLGTFTGVLTLTANNAFLVFPYSLLNWIPYLNVIVLGSFPASPLPPQPCCASDCYHLSCW